MSTIIVCNSASSPYATANGSETISRLSTIPFIELRRYCLFVRSAAAGTPTTARTLCASVLPFTPTRRRRCLSSSRTASTSFSEPSFSRPRSSGRCRSSMVRFETASCPIRTSRLRTLRATMSSGHPTKLSTTKRSPFDAEIALRDVPRSMPTWRMSSAMIRDSFLLRTIIRARIGAAAVEQRVGDLLPVLRAAQHRGLLCIRQATDFRQHGGHVGGDEDQERRPFDAPVFESGIAGAQFGVELVLHDGRELVRLVAARVGVHAVEELAHVAEGVAGDAVLLGGELRQRRIAGRAEVIRLDAAARGVFDDRVDVDRDEDVAAGLIGDPRAVFQGDGAVVGARREDDESVALEERAQALMDVERDRFLGHARRGRAGIGAAVTGVENNPPYRERERRGGDTLDRGGGGLRKNGFFCFDDAGSLDREDGLSSTAARKVDAAERQQRENIRRAVQPDAREAVSRADGARGHASNDLEVLRHRLPQNAALHTFGI